MVSPHWDPVTGGAERVLKRSALALRDRGHHVDILTLNTDARFRAHWRKEVLDWEGLRVVRWPALNLWPASRDGLYRWVWKAVNRAFPFNYVLKYVYAPGFARQARGYDLVQMHNDIEVGFMWHLRSVPVPKVLWCHTLDVTWRFHYRDHRFTSDILRRSADLFLTGCSSTVGPLREMGVPSQRIGTVHYGVDAQTFHPRPELKEPRTILFVGGLQEHKGGLVLLQALRHLRRPARVVLLTLTRDPTYGAAFQRALDEERARGVHDIVQEHDLRDQPRLVRFYQSATVFATPSLESVFELVNLEALACGTPVVASRVGGFPDLIHDDREGFLVPPGDPAALAARLEQVLDDPQLARRLGDTGRRTILGDFTWERAAEKLEAHYLRLLAPHRAPPAPVPAPVGSQPTPGSGSR